MTKHAINWFEIPVTNLPRAIEFYQDILGIEFKQEQMDGVELAIFPADETGIAGALIKAEFLQPGDQGCLVYLNVEGMMDDVISKAQARGVNLFLEKTHIGEPGYIAHIGDSEGNKIALHSKTE